MLVHNVMFFWTAVSRDVRQKGIASEISLICSAVALYVSFVFVCCSPSAEKKVLEQKPSGDMNGYQIRV